MGRIAEIIARLTVIDTRQAAIEQDADLNHDGQFTADSRTEYNTLRDERDTLATEKTTLEADAINRAERVSRASDLVAVAVPRRVAPGTSAPVVPTQQTTITPVDATGLNNGPPNPDTPRFTVPIRALRGGSPQNFHGVAANGMRPEERAYRFGMWAMSRIAMCMPQYSVQAATNFVNSYMGGIFNTAHGETDGTTGGHFLVPEEFDSDLIVLRERYGIARRLLMRSVMTGDTKHEPKRNTGLTAYFVGESQTGTESNMTWGDVQLIAKDIMAITRMTNQLSADAAINVGDRLAGEISYAFAQKEDDCAFNGDATSTYGGIQGFRNMLVNIDGGGTASAGAKTAASTGSWSNIALADFNATLGLLPQYADTPNACWVAHKTFYHTVMQKLELAAGGVTSREIQEGNRTGRPLFLGYPVEFSQVFPAVTAATGIMCIFGDLQLAAVFGDRQQTSIAFSESATVGGESVFEKNQIAVRGTERFDINCHGCGTSAAVGAVVGLRTG